MSSPEPLLSPTPVGKIMVSSGALGAASGARAAPGLTPCPIAANEDLTPKERPAQASAEGETATRVPLSAWLSLAFWAIGTALLFSLGVAYRLFA